MRCGGPGDSAEAASAVVVFEREAQVTVGEDARGSHQPGAARDEDRVRVAQAEGRKFLERVEEILCDLGEAKFEVEAELFGGRGQAKLVGGDVGERIAQLRHMGGGQREADCVRVATEPRKEFAVGLLVRGGEGVEQMEAGNGAAGAMRSRSG